MNAQEIGKCDFCGETKPVLRQYLHALHKEHIDDNKHTPFTITRYCADCGLAELPATEVAVNPTRQHSMKCPKLHGDECTCDGYHTFDELYNHRIRLFIELCRKIDTEDEQQKSLRAFKEGFAFDRNGWIRKVWVSVQHSDGSTFGDWFVLGIGKEKGKQITYHLPARFWNEVCEFAEVLDKAPEYDGHTSDDVLERLRSAHN